MTPSKLMLSLGLDQYVGSLESVGISAELLPYVTPRDLGSAGIPEEHHDAIMAGLAELQSGPPSASVPPAPQAVPKPVVSPVAEAPPPMPKVETNPFEAPAELRSTFSSFEEPGLYDDAMLASRSARFWAKLIDNLATGAGAIPGYLLLFMGGSEVAIILGGLLALLGVLGVAGFNWFLTATEGKTIGKRAMGARIVKLDGSPVDFTSGVVMRSWVMGLILAVSGLLGLNSIVSLVDVLFIFASDQRCIHDHIAGTKVVVG